MGDPTLELPVPEKTPGERLDSWKEIAAYMKRDVTTVQRWEKREGMPVHRHLHDKRGSVYALPAELDAWQKGRRPDAATEELEAEPVSPSNRTEEQPLRPGRSAAYWFLLAGIAAVLFVGASTYFVFRGRTKETVQPRVRSLAVLPFRNLSGDASQDYLAEGVTEALIGRLAGIRDLRVTSHTLVMQFKNPQQSVPEIARTLGVDAVVEGSVVREGNRIRVTAQLIRGATDEHFWSETYDREMLDALALESELAQAITAKVEATVTGQEQQRLVAARPVAPEVYESYLKGRFALDKANDRAAIEGAIGYFEDALRRDPGFAPAYVGLAAAYNGLSTVFIGAPLQDARRKAMDAVRKALELDPNLSEAHDLLAGALQDEWHWAEAESEYRRTLELNPNDAHAHVGYANWLLSEGRTDEAVEWMHRARELDPLTVSSANIAWLLFHSRRYDEAIQELRSQLALQPEDPGALWFLGFVLIAKDEPAEAIPFLEKAANVSNRSPGVLGVLIRAYAHAGRRSDALRVLEELKKRRSNGYVPAGAFVNAYLGLGDTEEAFVWLEKAYQEKSNILQFVKTHPYFDPIRDDPRFVDLVRRIGLG
jgi:pentatricopeptide repeat protein